MSNFLITLTPVDKFFFGGDMTFYVHGETGHNEKFGTYIIGSAMFPQQTSLLGMLRFLLLRSDKSLFDGENIISGKASQVADLIGASSFAVKNGGKDDSCFGKICRLHRCFVRCEEKDGTVRNLDFMGFDHDICNENQGAVCGYINGRKVMIPSLGGYDPKKGYRKVLSDGHVKKELKDVFAEDRRIGIQRDIVTGKTSDSSLFKQISYRFRNTEECKYRFAFYLEAEADMIGYDGEIVSVGADNSQFVIGVAEVADIPECKKAGAPHKIVLQSPAYISREVTELASFAFTEVIPFRFLETNVSDTENYSVLPRYKGANRMKSPTRSERYELYAPGSVFYFENEAAYNAFIAALDEYKGFRQIGYNEY